MKNTARFHKIDIRKFGWMIIYLLMRIYEVLLNVLANIVNQIYMLIGFLRYIVPIFTALPLLGVILRQGFGGDKLHIWLIDIDVPKHLIIPSLIFIAGLIIPILLRLLLSHFYKSIFKSLYNTKIKQSKIELYKKIPFLHNQKTGNTQRAYQTKQHKKVVPQQAVQPQEQKSQSSQEEYVRQAQFYKTMYEQEKQRREQEKMQTEKQPKQSTEGSDFFAGCDTTESKKKRYRELMKIYHPDNQNGNSEMLIKIQAAYEKIHA